MPSNPKSPQNLATNGRPKGVLNKATRLKRELAAPGIGLKETPAQILAANMQYSQAAADEILAEIDAAMKRGIPAAELRRELEEACKFQDQGQRGGGAIGALRSLQEADPRGAARCGNRAIRHPCSQCASRRAGLAAWCFGGEGEYR
jgi:hypothetical protein